MIKRMRKKLDDMIKHVRKNRHFWRNVAMFTLSVFVFIFGVGALWVASFKIPDFNSLESIKIINSTKIYDRTGEIILYDINKDIRRTNIPFEEMGANIKNATVAVEDSEFYNHNGIRLSSIFRATIWAKLTGKKVTGGSTITQQLIKNTLLNSRVTPARKIKEWVLALKIERELPKEKILELYLNAVPYGGTLYGIQEASRTYFNKNPADLTIAEAAYLASIPQSPSVLSPYGKNLDKLEERKNFVLFRMKEVGFVTPEEYETAKAEVVSFSPQALGGIKAPHFVFFIKDYLEQKYGSELVQKGGLKVTTTLDYELEQKAEEFVKEGALKNEKDWNGKNASLVAIDPKTGQILSMVGSRDYFDKEIDGNFNVATAFRQPGSSFKPFIYATAFNKGFVPETVLFDLPTEFQSTCNAYGKAFAGHSQGECYMPSNYDGLHRGPMSLRDALGQSINIPAVKLFFLVGLKDALRTAEEMGISTLTDVGRYGLTLVIGGGEVSLLDITSAYGVFANDGVRNPYTGILKVEDVNGNILEEYRPNSREVLPKNTALTISDILSDNVARTPTFGSNSVLRIPGKDVAVKTGTTNNNKDAWTVGYTPSIVVGVWAGNNDNIPMKKGGSALAGPIWNKFINEALKKLPSETFEEPNSNTETLKPILRGFWQGNESFVIDKISGKLATENTPLETREEKVITNVHTILYWVDRNDILGPPPENPQNSPQFNNWEIPIQNWWTQNKYKYSIVREEDKPNTEDDVHIDSLKPIVSIIEPNETKTYKDSDRIRVEITSSGKLPLKKIDVFINGLYVGTSEYPFNYSFTPKELDDLKYENEIKIIAYDSAFNRGEVVSIFKVEE
jgi:penicillin-binding protein 1C